MGKRPGDPAGLRLAGGTGRHQLGALPRAGAALRHPAAGRGGVLLHHERPDHLRADAPAGKRQPGEGRRVEAVDRQMEAQWTAV